MIQQAYGFSISSLHETVISHKSSFIHRLTFEKFKYMIRGVGNSNLWRLLKNAERRSSTSREGDFDSKEISKQERATMSTLQLYLGTTEEDWLSNTVPILQRTTQSTSLVEKPYCEVRRLSGRTTWWRRFVRGLVSRATLTVREYLDERQTWTVPIQAQCIGIEWSDTPPTVHDVNVLEVHILDKQPYDTAREREARLLLSAIEDKTVNAPTCAGNLSSKGGERMGRSPVKVPMGWEIRPISKSQLYGEHVSCSRKEVKVLDAYT